jgi:hypothetical protein
MGSITLKMIEMVENCVLSRETVARECLQNMSDDAVADMAFFM